VRSVIDGSRQRDIDLFFGSEEAYAEFERRIRNRSDVEITEYPAGHREGARAFISVIRSSDGTVYDVCNWFYGQLADHIDNNEWLHNCAACDLSGTLHIRPEVYRAIIERRLVPCNSKWFPWFQLERLLKYRSQGWQIDEPTLQKVHERLGLAQSLDIKEVLT
jgi:hypothetical protein